MNSSGKCVLFSCFAQTCRYVQGFKMLGGDVADLGLKVSLVASSDRRGKVKLALKRTFVLESL